jgi:tetratricopeptide (TPR) repeat protein
MKQVLCLLLIIISGSLVAQSLHETEAFAQQRYEAKDYETAAEAYRRVLFFDEKNEYSPWVYKKIADCLFETSAYEEASKYYSLAYFTQNSDEEKATITLQKAACHLLTRNYPFAQEELLYLPEKLTPKQDSARYFYEGMLFFALEDFQKAEAAFKKIAVDTLAVHQIFRKNEKVSKINPKTAKTLSIIFPGLGQLYVGDIKNGLNSMALTGALLYLGVRTAANATFLDAVVSVVPWFQRYYTGGFYKAELIAQQRKQEKRHQVFNELLNTVNEK